MGDLLGSPRVVPFCRFFFFFKSTDPSHFICYGRRMRPERDEEGASKSSLSAMLTRNCQKFPTDAFWPSKPLQMSLFTATQERNPTLARGDQGGRATACNAHLARRFRAVSYKLATSLERARFMRNSAAAYTKFNIFSARTRRVRSYHH